MPAPETTCPTTSDNLSIAFKLHFASTFSVAIESAFVCGLTLTARSSSPITQQSAGTLIGNTSL